MKAATNRRLRSLHYYLGVFFAPAILFFAVSGGVQTFRLNEAPGAPAWLGWIASVHKDQTTPRPRPPEGAQPGERPHGDHRGGQRAAKGPRRSPLPLKIFVALLAAGLALSAALGIALALATPTRRRGSAVMLALGTLLPLGLLFV